MVCRLDALSVLVSNIDVFLCWFASKGVVCCQHLFVAVRVASELEFVFVNVFDSIVFVI